MKGRSTSCAGGAGSNEGSSTAGGPTPVDVRNKSWTISLAIQVWNCAAAPTIYRKPPRSAKKNEFQYTQQTHFSVGAELQKLGAELQKHGHGALTSKRPSCLQSQTDRTPLSQCPSPSHTDDKTKTKLRAWNHFQIILPFRVTSPAAPNHPPFPCHLPFRVTQHPADPGRTTPRRT